MKKNEWITLGVGIVIIAALAWFGGIFSSSINSSAQSMNQKTSSIPPVQGTNISTDPNLQVIEVQVGTSTAAAKKGSHVYVNYTGMLDTGVIFDSSYGRGVPIDFVLGQGSVIKGWDLGLVGMKVGGKRRLVIAPDYAYGAAGVQGVIPGNATLTFDVELVNIK